MQVILALILEKIPSWAKWLIGIIVFMMWAPLAVRDYATSFVHKEAEAVVISYQDKQNVKDAIMLEKLNAIKEDVAYIKDKMK